MIYGAVNRSVLELVPDHARSVLDVGCGDGSLGAELKRRAPRRVVGLTRSPEEAALASRVLDQVEIVDLDQFAFDLSERFDCIVLSHVLEHLRSPAEVLERSSRLLTSGGWLVVALPNALYWRQRLEFLRGHFRYADGGIMDRTHLVFFDWHTARELIEAAGLALIEARSVGGLPGSRWLPSFKPDLDRWATRLAPGLFGTEFVMVASRPGVAAAGSRE